MQTAYDRAGVSAADVGVAEVHDCFSVMGALGAEVLGKAEYGQGARYWADGKAAVDGECGINTSGGLIAKGHPIGATGIAMVGWSAWQLLGKVPAGAPGEDARRGRDLQHRRPDLRLGLHGPEARLVIEYRTGNDLDLDEVIEVYVESTLGERRPVADRERMAGMLREANLVLTAWDGERLVGISRSVSDFHYATYLSDLAVRLLPPEAGDRRGAHPADPARRPAGGGSSSSRPRRPWTTTPGSASPATRAPGSSGPGSPSR